METTKFKPFISKTLAEAVTAHTEALLENTLALNELLHYIESQK